MRKLRMGYTTGACAAAASKAALIRLMGDTGPLDQVALRFATGVRHQLPIAFARSLVDGAEAAVVKDAGDDPDVTHGALVVAKVQWTQEQSIVFRAGDGVGTVTRPGLAMAPGEPAINPGPRRMIRSALRELTDRPVQVTISIPGGGVLAEKTFNPRLGIVNGLSVLGTTGRVRPFSCKALRYALVCALDVARACRVRAPVLVPGNIGWQAARQLFDTTPEQVIEAGNAWGFLLERLERYGFEQMLLLGHPGKLAKLADGQWDTHSARSASAVDTVMRLAEKIVTGEPPVSATTEGIFSALARNERRRLADVLSAAIASTVQAKLGGCPPISVVLVDLKGEPLGKYGDLQAWLKI